MRQGNPRWVEVTPSRFYHEHVGLEHVREHLPDDEPYRAWTNFEIVVHGGAFRRSECLEVDLLVLTPRCFYLVELKGWRGPVRGGESGLWEAGPRHFEPDPYRATDRKAKILKSALERARKHAGLHTTIPFVEAVVFLCNPLMRCELTGARLANLFGREDVAGGARLPGIVSKLTHPVPGRRVSSDDAAELVELLNTLDIRRRRRKVSGYVLAEDVFASGPEWREFLAEHESVTGRHARVRLYHSGWTATDEQRVRIDRAAERESRLDDLLSHPNIVMAAHLLTEEEGPALIYPFNPRARRLDAVLNASDATESPLAIRDRMRILREVAEALSYAHAQGVTHGSLSPQSIFVVFDNDPTAQVSDWQTASVAAPTTANAGEPFSSVLAGTQHASALLADDAQQYRAPETSVHRDHDPVRADVFSLGVVAYRVLGGRVPDRADQLWAQVFRDSGLRLHDPDLPAEVSELVFSATQAQVGNRPADVAGFLALDSWTHPADAKQGTLLANRWRVIRRLGSGSCAYALLVDDRVANQQYVMKIARSTEHNDLLAQESETLAPLDHPGIVRLIEGPITVSGLTAVVTEYAGEETLATTLSETGPLSGSTLRSWGGELLATAIFLKDNCIIHRDIKPDNIGVRPESTHTGHRLVLFDFSHSLMPVAAVGAGTSAYLDPFLGSAERLEWDSAAENYALAVTLFQMATGTTPVFGDGLSHPRAVNDQATVEQHMFSADSTDPPVGSRLAQFFRRALLRDATQRFPDIQAMRSAWEAAFTPAAKAQSITDSDSLEQRLEHITMTQRVRQELVIQGGRGLPGNDSRSVSDSGRTAQLVTIFVILVAFGVLLLVTL